MIHLMDQINTIGPLYLHHMFTYEWFLSILKGYVRNHAHQEGSIVEGYNTEEVVECLSIAQHKGRLRGRGKMG
jgi:hypothetical protein